MSHPPVHKGVLDPKALKDQCNSYADKVLAKVG